MINFKVYKNASFYLALISSILSLIAAISFKVLSKNIELVSVYTPLVLIFSIITIVVLIGLSVLKITFKYGKIVNWLLILANFLFYINTIYMYFAGVFYNGVTSEAIATIDVGVIVSIISFVIALIVSNVSMYIGNKEVK